MLQKIILTIMAAGVICGETAFAGPAPGRDEQKKPVMIADQQKAKLTHRQETALIKLQQNLRKERNAMLEANGGKKLTLEQSHQLRDEENKTKQQIMLGKNLTGDIEKLNSKSRQGTPASPLTREQQQWLTREMIRTNRELYSRKSGENSAASEKK